MKKLVKFISGSILTWITSLQVLKVMAQTSKGRIQMSKWKKQQAVYP